MTDMNMTDYSDSSNSTESGSNASSSEEKGDIAEILGGFGLACDCKTLNIEGTVHIPFPMRCHHSPEGPHSGAGSSEHRPPHMP
jgi:hypothetical protein